MPLITCPDCQREISDSAPACPGCGRPHGELQNDFLRADERPYRPKKRSRGRAAARLFIILNIGWLACVLGVAFLNDHGAFDGVRMPSFIPSVAVDFHAGGEGIIRQLGSDIIGKLSRESASCSRHAKIDTVITERDWLFSRTGSSSLFISGGNDTALKLEYRLELAGDKMYAIPKDPDSAQQALAAFLITGCR
ncbi:Uncharacterised protein [Pseudomonas putida]|nr:Uncharacterised protein [Pseudomonas putida]